MNLYRISPYKHLGYDTYTGAIVAAPDAETAARMHPRDGSVYNEPDQTSPYSNAWYQRWLADKDLLDSDGMPRDWCDPSKVTVKFIGVAAEGTQQGVVMASFNAG
jgi:hypothetical protein